MKNIRFYDAEKYKTAEYDKVEKYIYKILKIQSDDEDSLIFMLFEYLKALKILRTRNVLTIRNKRKSLNPELRTVIVGRIETRSTIAHGVKGYFTKAIAE
ncbi:hypothetical protein SAMN05216540_11715 [Butyrivibrio sp. M55]|nr:hypothetical protein SAMN05216540_11715 [Butyrivibrio sp. M55]